MFDSQCYFSDPTLNLNGNSPAAGLEPNSSARSTTLTVCRDESWNPSKKSGREVWREDAVKTLDVDMSKKTMRDLVKKREKDSLSPTNQSIKLTIRCCLSFIINQADECH